MEVRAQLPDPSLRLNGLDRIGQQAFMGLPGAQFRINTWREQHRLDYDPSHARVDQLVLLLVAELELATAHAPGKDTSQQRPPKHPRVAKVEADTHQDPAMEAALDASSPKAKGKGKYSSPKGPKGASPQLPTPNKDEPTASKTLCKGYLTAKGCAYGDSCKFTHDYAEAGRCALLCLRGYQSPELAHRRPDCPANQRMSMSSPTTSPNRNPESPKGRAKGPKGKPPKQGKGNPQLAAADALTAPAAEASQPSQSSSVTQAPNASTATVAAATLQPSTRQVEQEALRLLKDLKLSRLSVASSCVQDGGSPMQNSKGEPSVAVLDVGTHAPWMGQSGHYQQSAREFESTYGSLREGILDSGATNVLRTAGVEEYHQSQSVEIRVPVGMAMCRLTEAGTVVTLDTVPPVLPLGKIISFLGCEFSWDVEGPTLWHPSRGFLDVRVLGNRVRISQSDTCAMVKEIEVASSLWESQTGYPSVNGLQPMSEPQGISITVRVARTVEEGFGLVDGGATNALRQASHQELLDAQPINVELAAGSTELRINDKATLLTEQPVTPILPLGPAIQYLRCKLEWNRDQVHLVHPVRGPLPVTLVKGCPMLPRKLTLELIEELESQIYTNTIRRHVMKLLESDCQHQGSPDTPLHKLLQKQDQDSFVAIAASARRWFPEVPGPILERVIPTFHERIDASNANLNRRTRRRIQKAKKVLVHLFAGSQTWKMAPDEAILEVERSKGRDLLSEPLYEYLFRLALQGKIDGIIGGPPCTTFSRARSRSSGPRVLCRRYGHQRFGMESLTEAESALLLQDNVLILRMLFLIKVAQESRGEACFVAIEHPRDPAELSSEPAQRNLPSMWEWPEVEALNRYSAQVDQGTLGHRDVKPTTVATSSWELSESLHNKLVPPVKGIFGHSRGPNCTYQASLCMGSGACATDGSSMAQLE